MTSPASGQWVLLTILALLTAGAWTLTIYQARSMNMPMDIVVRDEADGGMQASAAAPDSMDGMAIDTAPTDPAEGMAANGMVEMADAAWTWGGFVTFVVAWAVMMAAMMFPAAAPMLLLFQRVSAQREAMGGSFVPTWVFAAGYLAVWTAVAVPAWVFVQLESNVAARLDAADHPTWAPLALGAVLVVAGLYQFTPLKAVCLRHCQSPVGFVMSHWRDGHGGALRMGVAHGAHCLGCCWALFAVLVAAGVMSLAWMLLLTLVVFAEKVLPLGRRASLVIGAALLLLGVLVGARTVAMPWLA